MPTTPPVSIPEVQWHGVWIHEGGAASTRARRALLATDLWWWICGLFHPIEEQETRVGSTGVDEGRRKGDRSGSIGKPNRV